MRKFILLLAALVLTTTARADEGMWLLTTLKQLNGADMASKGLKISPDQIYNANGSSLKDAIVIFGGGCTGEIVSSEGLLFTNHHCGYGNIQSLSSVEHDYLKNGFWAMNKTEEIPAPGLRVTFIRHIEDITAQVLNGVAENLSQKERDEAVRQNVHNLEAEYAKRPEFAGMRIQIRDFFGGNQYILFANEIYSDVRLVGTPPSSIGKFGGDTDNWMWPRHTGDFSIFRVYAGADNKPADYSPDNVPYKAPVHLKVSLKGVKEGDFAMIMGFPGSTNRYMTSYEIDQVLEVDNPNRIDIRGQRQEIIWGRMEASDEIRIKYASKYAGSSNYWKNSIGMSQALRKLNIKAQKQDQESRFVEWVAASPARAKYAKALPQIEEAVKGRTPYSSATQIIMEAGLRGIEIVSASSLGSRLTPGKDGTIDPSLVERIRQVASGFYKDYDESLDREVAVKMLEVLRQKINAENLPSIYTEIDSRFGGDYAAYVTWLYDNSVYSNQTRFESMLDAGDYSALKQDPAEVLRQSLMEVYNENRTKQMEYGDKFREGHRLYIAGLLEMESDKMHYPDANFTIRCTYGNVLSYSPADAVIYKYYTTLSGVMAKEDPSNPMEFTVPERLKELYAAKDFGQYAENGDVPVGFLSNNDITGGNSGSPVLNDKGELIGLAFDGNWEAMSGDITFEPELQRCINVDIRYVLFVIDKYAGATNIINELTLVR